jgi:hypothetical protein
MAQQMRVRDQEIIVKKVVNALEENGLLYLETMFGKDSDVNFLKEEVKRLSSLKEKIRKLRDQETELERSINRGVEDYNTAHNFDRNNGLNVSLGYGHRKDETRKVFFNFNIDWDKKTEIADALALQTIGTDFKWKDLVANLVAEFS